MAAAAAPTAADWLQAHVTADDAKLLTPLFAKQGIASATDVLALSKDDLVEMNVSIGPRNRFLDAQQKAKASSTAAAAVAAPAAPSPPQSLTATAPSAYDPWTCSVCGISYPTSGARGDGAPLRARCNMCGAPNPNVAARGGEDEQWLEPTTAASTVGGTTIDNSDPNAAVPLATTTTAQLFGKAAGGAGPRALLDAAGRNRP